MTKDEALELALEALEWANKEINAWMDDAQGLDPEEHPEIMFAINAIKEALAQPEQEPVAWLNEEKKIIYWHNTHETDDYHGFKRTTPLYTTPPQQEPVAQCTESDSWNCKYCRKTESCKALQDPRNFASPPQRKPLTDEQLQFMERGFVAWPKSPTFIEVARAIERAHGIKE